MNVDKLVISVREQRDQRVRNQKMNLAKNKSIKKLKRLPRVKSSLPVLRELAMSRLRADWI